MLTRSDDVPARHLARRLTARGTDVSLFDPGGFPTRAVLSAALTSDGRSRRRLVTDDETVDLDALAAVWLGRPGTPMPHRDVVDPIMREYIQHECRLFAADLWNSLRCRAVPARPDVTQAAAHKVSGLLVAGELGFEIPPTLVTTDPDELLDFYCAHDGRIVTKVIEQVSLLHDDAGFFRLTEPVSARDIANAATLRLCPIIVQPYVPKAFEVRATVVGERVFAAEIHAQGSARGRLDWRSYDRRATILQPHQLPDDVEARCRRLVQRLGLGYGAIDLIVTPDGRYIFLEVNPTGQYFWIEEATGLPITDALCDLLLGLDGVPERALHLEHVA
jgi:hypothetical protein